MAVDRFEVSLGGEVGDPRSEEVVCIKRIMWTHTNRAIDRREHSIRLAIPRERFAKESVRQCKIRVQIDGPTICCDGLLIAAPPELQGPDGKIGPGVLIVQR